MKKLLVASALAALFCVRAFGQVYPNIDIKKITVDAEKQEGKKYPYMLPIWGEKATQRGFQLPYSAGFSVQYLWQESDLVLDNLMVGFNNGPMINLDQVIRFDSAVAAANAVNVRPDIWLFPFLNVYGIFAKARTSTSISAGLWIPDADNNWSQATAFSSKANFNATTFGFGMTPTIGIGGYWLALDMNVAWTDVSALNKPVFTFIFGPRLGKTFKLKKPDQNIAFWVGGFRVKFTSETNGSPNLSEVLPIEGLQDKVDQGFDKVGTAQAQVDAWWNSLSAAEQQNPVNIARFNTANQALAAAGNLLTAVDGALSNAETATVQYSLEKRPKDMWNVIVGSQFQLNRHWMIRAEYGFLTSRKQFIGGLQYRFGL
jgi:hypothetical protein